MKAPSHRPTFLLLALALLLWPTAPGAWAQADSAEVGADAASYGRGFALFQRYCRSCHGKNAKGDGHVAKFLKVEPTNLTLIAAKNDGEFPTEATLSQIDGRQEMVPLHGRDMPIWGAVFEVDEGQTEADVQKKLNDLLAYLKGIQVEGDASGGESEPD